jgi:hypothetical protein
MAIERRIGILTGGGMALHTPVNWKRPQGTTA